MTTSLATVFPNNSVGTYNHGQHVLNQARNQTFSRRWGFVPKAPTGRGLWRGIPPSRLEGLGSVVGYPSGVWGGAPAASEFYAFFFSEFTGCVEGSRATDTL